MPAGLSVGEGWEHGRRQEPGADTVYPLPVDDDDQQMAARVVRDHGLVAVPVIDGEGHLIGALMVHDAMRVLEREESEDAARQAPRGRASLVSTQADSA